jgi:branched-chain amino acid transport system substrate-binding protein
MKAWQMLLKAAVAAIAAGTAFGVHAQGTIKIGEINTYRLQPGFVEPHKKGMELAIEEINAAGGVLGKKLELFTRDDNSNPGDAVRVAEELVSREKVDVLTGVMFSHVGLGVANFAKQKKMFYLASEPLSDKLVWGDGNKYTYRLRSSTYMQAAMLVPQAAAMKKKRWGILYQNFEYGQSAAASFKKLLKAAQPDVEFVVEQAVPLGKIDAAATAQAILDAKPDAVFSALFGPDLPKFIREANSRGLLNKDLKVVSMLIGEPEYLDSLKGEAPVGWLVTGYPWYDIKTPEHMAFLNAYRKKFNDYPRLGSVVGYSAIYSLAEGINKAKSTKADALAAAFKGMTAPSPFGKIYYRPQDNQSTMGAYVGTLAVKDGKGVMVNHKYLDGKDFQPSDAEVKKLRAAD